MYRKMFFLFYVLVICLSLTNTVYANNQQDKNSAFVHAKDTLIVDEMGKPIIMKGIGLGGWMVQEGYIIGTRGAQHEIKSFLEDVAGVEATNQFYDDWLTFFVNHDDIKQIADWGYNSIRLPMHYELYFDKKGNWLRESKGLELTDSLLAWCKRENLYLFLDLHAAPGGQGNNKDISDRREGESLWTSEKYRNMTLEFWYQLAKKYKNEASIAGYDLINEPNYDFDNTGNTKGCTCTQNAPLRKIFEDLIDTIRLVDKNHLLIVEGNCYGSNYNGMESLGSYDPEQNLAFSFHNYWGENTMEAMQSILKLRRKLNIPLWRGEIGENSNTWFTNMVELMDDLNIGFANWPWKKINNLDGPVIIDPIPEWNELIAYEKDNNLPKPSKEVAQKALKKLVENLKLEKCRLMHDVAYAYINSPNGEGTKPFAKHTIPGTINLTDYDLGKWGESWYDVDFQNTSGRLSNTAWNKGVHYRNDGVDIWQTNDEFSNGYFVGDIRNGEWLTFTLENIKEGNYEVAVRARNKSQSELAFNMFLEGESIFEKEQLIGNSKEWKTFTFESVNISKGKFFKVLFINSGLEISSITFK